MAETSNGTSPAPTEVNTPQILEYGGLKIGDKIVTPTGEGIVEAFKPRDAKRTDGTSAGPMVDVRYFRTDTDTGEQVKGGQEGWGFSQLEDFTKEQAKKEDVVLDLGTSEDELQQQKAEKRAEMAGAEEPKPVEKMDIKETLDEVREIRDKLVKHTNDVLPPLNISDALPPSVQETIRQEYLKRADNLPAEQRKDVDQTNAAHDETEKWDRYLTNQENLDTQFQQLQDKLDMSRKTRAGYSANEASPSGKAQMTKEIKKFQEELDDFVVANIPEAMWGDYKLPSDKIVEKKHLIVETPEGTPVNDFLKKQENWREIALSNRDTEENKLKKQRDAAVEDVRRLREEAATPTPHATGSELDDLVKRGIKVPGTMTDSELKIYEEYKKSQEEIEKLKLENEQLKTAAIVPPVEPVSAEPELEMENLEVTPVDPRNRFERIRDGIIERFDPRDKDLLWRIGAVAGISEAVAVSFAPIPGGRIAASALNFLAAQGIGVGVEVWRRAEISHARGEYENNDLIQRILDINDHHKLASDRTKNFFAGLSAGMTVGSIGTLVYGAVEGFVAPHPAIATEAPKPPIFPTPPIEHVPTQETLNPVITIPDHGNFWTAWHIDSSSAANWTDLHNGTTHTDVIKDMVVKLARANGHELGIVHAGDQIDLGKVLTLDQLELVKKAAKAKSYQEYLSGVRPGYLSFLNK